MSMDLITYPSMDAFPFQQQQQQLFDSVDETFEMEQLLAAAFDSSSSPELFQYHSNEDDICFDPLYSTSEFFVDDRNDVILAHHDALFQQNLFMSPFDQFDQLDNCFHKRQKINQNDYVSNSFYLDLVTPPPQLMVTPPPQPLPFSIPPVFSHGISSNKNNGVIKNEMEEESRSLSAQSLSARQRRRKISEKTKELGKLVPGGQKMNTAEMFEAASSYIKFLQAQFAILQLMESPSSSSSSSEEEAASAYVHDEEDLQCLVGSPLVQEKLYLKQKCIVPRGLVESLENNNEIQSNSQTLKDIKNLILTFC